MEFIFYRDFLMSTIAAFGASVPQRRPPSIGPQSEDRFKHFMMKPNSNNLKASNTHLTAADPSIYR